MSVNNLFLTIWKMNNWIKKYVVIYNCSSGLCAGEQTNIFPSVKHFIFIAQTAKAWRNLVVLIHFIILNTTKEAV